MIIFPYKRTKRLAVQLREITYGEAMAVCRLPAERHEATTTEFLKFVASKAESPTASHVTDPRLWTVEERALMVCHYLSQVSEAADFEIGDGSAKLSDYVSFADDYKAESVSLGEIGGKQWTMRPLLGLHVEVLELLCKDQGEWITGALACQARPTGEASIDLAAMPDIKLMEWCSDSIKAMKDLPESEFGALYAASEMARPALRHFFNTDIGEDGVMFWPQEKEGGPAYPARFRALSCLSEETKRLFRKPPQPGS